MHRSRDDKPQRDRQRPARAYFASSTTILQNSIEYHDIQDNSGDGELPETFNARASIVDDRDIKMNFISFDAEDLGGKFRIELSFEFYKSMFGILELY